MWDWIALAVGVALNISVYLRVRDEVEFKHFWDMDSEEDIDLFSNWLYAATGTIPQYALLLWRERNANNKK